MKVKLNTDRVRCDHPGVSSLQGAGEVIELDDAEARRLIESGQAEPAPEGPEAATHGPAESATKPRTHPRQ